MILGRTLTAASLLALTGAVALPFAATHLAWRDLADAYIHLVRIYAVGAALADGALYARWLPDLYLGYGYPLLNFYAPATYYLGAALHRAGMTIYASFQALAILAAAAGALGTFTLARALRPRSRLTGLAAAAAYLLAPYPFLTNLYVRAAIPEALALGLLPWVVLAALRAVQGPGHGVPVLALAVALLILTHNVTALITFPLLCLWAAALVLTADRRPRERAARAALGLAAGLGLAAFFWLPALTEGRHVQLDLLRGGIYEPRTWLFDPLAPFYRDDYPHTFTGPADLALRFDYSALDRGVPPKPSLAQLVWWLTGLAGAGAQLWRLRHSRAASADAAVIGLVAAALAVLCWLFVTAWSAPLWDALPLLATTQFPWRFYGPAALFVALSGALGLAPLLRTRTVVGVALTGGVCALLAINALARRPVLAAPDPPHDVDSRVVVAEEYDRYGAGTTGGGEFLPRTAAWDDGPPRARRGIRLYDRAFPQASWQAGAARIVAGRAAIVGVHRTPDRIVADVDAASPATIAFHQLLFRGWRGAIDGRSLPPEPVEPTLHASLGFMTLPVEPGRHRVEVIFAPTPIRAAGAAASCAIATALLLSLVARRGGAPRRSRTTIVAASLAAGLLPVVHGEVAARPLCCADRPAAARVLADATTLLQTGAAQSASPIGTGRGPLAPYLEPRYLTLGAETRRALYMHPTSSVSFEVEVSPRAFLQTALAIESAAWTQAAGDGVRFVAEVEAGGRRDTILDRVLDPRARPDDRRWVDVWADLGRYAGHRVRLILRTEPREDPAFDWAAWAHPQVTVWRAARPSPAEPHPW